MIHAILTVTTLTAGFIGIVLLMRYCIRQERETEAAELREMLRQDKIRENREWYINPRTDDARADLIRVWATINL